MNQETRWRKTLAWLRRNFPVASDAHSVVVHRVSAKRMPKFDGECTFDGEVFHIRINRNKSFALQLDALLHEWAHAQTWFTQEEDECHTAEWGVAYARLYRNFWAWDYGRTSESLKTPEED